MSTSSAPRASVAQLGLTEERARALHRSQALAVQKRERDGRVLSRRMEGLARLADGIGLDESSEEEEGGEAAGIGSGAASRPSFAVEGDTAAYETIGKKKAKSGKRRQQARGEERAALQNVLTYAHLFTLSPLLASPPVPTAQQLTTSYLALGPLPAGKRCLLVTGPARGTQAPIRLHTRVSARVLLRWQGAGLPGGTVLDCLLPEDWKASGKLWVVDCLRWKEMDIASSSASFRQYFLRSRLSELFPSVSSSPPPPPAPHKHPTHLVPLAYLPAPISPAQWSSLRTSGMAAKEGVLILEEDGTYVFGEEGEVGEAWWIGAEEVQDLLSIVSGMVDPAASSMEVIS